MELMDEALQEFPDIRAIVVDSYGAARSFAGNTQAYSFVSDYQFGSMLSIVMH